MVLHIIISIRVLYAVVAISSPSMVHEGNITFASKWLQKNLSEDVIMTMDKNTTQYRYTFAPLK